MRDKKLIQVQASIPESLYLRLDAAARSEHRSRSNMMCSILSNYFEEAA